MYPGPILPFEYKPNRRQNGRRKIDNFYHLLIENMNEGVFIINFDGTFIYSNKKFSDLLSLPVNEIVGQRINNFLDNFNNRILLKNFTDCIRGYSPVVEITWTKKNGEQMISRISSRSLNKSMVKEDLVFSIVTNITENKKIEETLIQSEKKYSTVVNNSLTGIYIEKNGTIIFANPCFIDILGYNKNELSKISALGLLQENQTCPIGEFSVHRKDGNKIWVKSTCNQIEYLGDPANLGSIIDITKQVTMENRLRNINIEQQLLSKKYISSQEMERKRIARDLHDGIGQTLSAVKVKIENLIYSRDISDARNDSLIELVSIIKGATEEVRRIAMALRPSILDDLGLKATINWLCREYQSAYPSIKVSLQIDVDEDDLEDTLKTAIYRILQEALNNIAKHSHANRVDLSLKNIDGKTELFISDNGTGLQEMSKLSGSSENLGLGLISMNERTELTRGQFSIHSNAEENGTIIRATWPL